MYIYIVYIYKYIAIYSKIELNPFIIILSGTSTLFSYLPLNRT